MRAVFGGRDVTDIVNKLKRPFIVDIEIFGDPTPFVYKFLLLSQPRGPTIAIGEHDKINDVKTVFTNPPVCKQVAPLSSFINNKKGLQIGEFLQGLDGLKIGTGLDKVDSFEHLEATRHYDFIIASQSNVNTKPILEHADFFVLVLPLKEKCNFTDLKIMYMQHTEKYQIYILTKPISKIEEDTKHDKPVVIHIELGPDGIECPFCGIGFVKDNNCMYVTCGLGNVFRVGYGCGRSFCFQCGKKFCGQHYDPETGLLALTYRDTHDAVCCTKEPDFSKDTYCPGGHNSHCSKRW